MNAEAPEVEPELDNDLHAVEQLYAQTRELAVSRYRTVPPTGQEGAVLQRIIRDEST